MMVVVLMWIDFHPLAKVPFLRSFRTFSAIPGHSSLAGYYEPSVETIPSICPAFSELLGVSIRDGS
jgi:hypothetical protein